MEQVPDILVKGILEFVSSTKDLLACLLTCKDWYRLLNEDDSIWKYCEGNHPVLEGQVPLTPDTWRESALVHHALKQCVAYEHFCGSVFVQTLLTSELQNGWWDVIVCQVITFLIQREAPALRVRLRSDTQLYLLNIVESFITQELRKLLIQAVRDDDGYPTAEGHELGFTGSIFRGGYEGNDGFEFAVLAPSTFTGEKVYKEGELRNYLASRVVIPLADSMDAAMRRTAFRAGITRVTPKTYELLGSVLLWVVYNLLRPAVIEAGCREQVQAQPEAPFVIRQLIAPHLIQETAKRMGISHQVYGIDFEDSSAGYEVVQSSEAGSGYSANLFDCIDVAEDESYVDSEQGYLEDDMFDEIVHGDPDEFAECSESDKDDDSVQVAFSGMDLS